MNEETDAVETVDRKPLDKNKENDDLTRRALSAWFRSGGTDYPSTQGSGVEQESGLSYVVLRNDGDILAIYRVKNDGLLRRLRRIPKAFRKGGDTL